MSKPAQMRRIDHSLVLRYVGKGSNALDLGCNDGTLMELLIAQGVKVQGIEINEDLVSKCIKKGLPVMHDDIDRGFSDYRDNTFDYVILNRTLQATHKPLLVMREALRIGKVVLVSFPNFGYYITRIQLFFEGKMPKNAELPHEWYDTPNIHLVTISDFTRFCNQNKFNICKKIYFDHQHELTPIMPNLVSPYALYILSGAPS
ncbi:MAG: methionine biosynthesis protein MetW [Candidatus Caenarcaniphilales bacterium]|nr:methionine biosynthesis protein MetW [Candidatus Caenarcaniphilales bacterium]